MGNEVKLDRLIIPVYINEKIVLDMLAILEDGFSMVSQVNYFEQKETSSKEKIEGGVATSSILSKLLKINMGSELSHTGRNEEQQTASIEKVHTNVSLLSKFRSFLTDKKMLKTEFDISKIQIGDFIEFEGEVQKNPLINYMDILIDIFKMANIFDEKPQLGHKTQATIQQQQENETVRQIRSFAEELKHSGTIDFILSDAVGTVVLSAQEKYLANDNVSEIIGGRFKVLGKVIAICHDETEEINLLRKTTLSVFSEELLDQLFSGFSTTETAQFNLPELVTKIAGPALIVIPVAIYA